MMRKFFVFLLIMTSLNALGNSREYYFEDSAPGPLELDLMEMGIDPEKVLPEFVKLSKFLHTDHGPLWNNLKDLMKSKFVQTLSPEDRLLFCTGFLKHFENLSRNEEMALQFSASVRERTGQSSDNSSLTRDFFAPFFQEMRQSVIENGRLLPRGSSANEDWPNLMAVAVDKSRSSFAREYGKKSTIDTLRLALSRVPGESRDLVDQMFSQVTNDAFIRDYVEATNAMTPIFETPDRYGFALSVFLDDLSQTGRLHSDLLKVFLNVRPELQSQFQRLRSFCGRDFSARYRWEDDLFSRVIKLFNGEEPDLGMRPVCPGGLNPVQAERFVTLFIQKTDEHRAQRREIKEDQVFREAEHTLFPLASRPSFGSSVQPARASQPSRAMEIHYAASLMIPDDLGHSIPLYKAVEKCLQGLRLVQMDLEPAKVKLHEWVDQYADTWQKPLYHRVVCQGYGEEGRRPDFYQEITPLLGFVVPYMISLTDAIRQTWLLPALEESAKAYDGIHTMSCVKGVQERLTVVGFDLEGVETTLRSLSIFSRQFLYISNSDTGGADAFVRAAIDHLTENQRQSLLGSTKPNQEDFSKMFMSAITEIFKNQHPHLLPIHRLALMNDERIKERFSDSLEMHYEVDKHYKSLMQRARDLETPEQRRATLSGAATSRLTKAGLTLDDLNLN